MTTTTLQREIKVLKARQARLERMVYEIAFPRGGEQREEVRPEYLRRLRRIDRDMKAGKGTTVVRTRKELKHFLRDL